MRLKRNLFQPFVLLTVVCLFLAFGGTAEAARLLGLTAPEPDTVETSKIVLLDTALGTSTVLADTGLTRSDAQGSMNTTSGPNGLAYEPATGTAYFWSIPESDGVLPDGGPPILYSIVVDALPGDPPPPPGPRIALGNPTPIGGGATDAAFFDGKYWYIDAFTDDLHSISFGGGFLDFIEKSDLLPAGETLVFGDIGIKDGILHGSARRDSAGVAGDVVFFTVDLNPLSMDFLVYMQHLAGAPGDPLPLGPVMQLGFGDDGTLFGVTGALTGFNDLYYVRLLAAQLGKRGLALEDFPGGPFTDMGQYNPVCDCPRVGDPGCAEEDDDDDDGICEEEDDD